MMAVTQQSSYSTPQQIPSASPYNFMNPSGMFVHSNPPKPLISSSTSLNSSQNTTIRNWVKGGDIDKLENLVLEGQGARLLGLTDSTSDMKVKTFLRGIPGYMSKVDLIHDAVIRGSVRELQTLLDKKKLSLARDAVGRGLAHKAVLHSQRNVLDWLGKKYPDSIQIRDNESRSPLHYSALAKSPTDMYTFLLNLGCNPEVVDIHGRKASYYLTNPQELYIDGVNGPIPDPRNSFNKRTSKSRFQQRRRISPISPKSSPSPPISSSNQPLNSSSNSAGALGNKNTPVTPYLPPSGSPITRAQIRIWIHEKDISKLESIVWSGNGDKLLLETTNNPKVRRFLDNVPFLLHNIKMIHTASIHDDVHGLQEIRSRIEQSCTDNPISSPNGSNAASSMDKSICRELFTARDSYGLSAMHKATGLNNRAAAEWLLYEFPATLNLQDNFKRTPLHYAAVRVASDNTSESVYKFLQKAGADTNTLDYRHRDAAYYLTHAGDCDSFKYLRNIPDAPRVLNNPERVLLGWDRSGVRGLGVAGVTAGSIAAAAAVSGNKRKISAGDEFGASVVGGGKTESSEEVEDRGSGNKVPRTSDEENVLLSEDDFLDELEDEEIRDVGDGYVADSDEGKYELNTEDVVIGGQDVVVEEEEEAVQDEIPQVVDQGEAVVEQEVVVEPEVVPEVEPEVVPEVEPEVVPEPEVEPEVEAPAEAPEQEEPPEEQQREATPFVEDLAETAPPPEETEEPRTPIPEEPEPMEVVPEEDPPPEPVPEPELIEVDEPEQDEPPPQSPEKPVEPEPMEPPPEQDYPPPDYSSALQSPPRDNPPPESPEMDDDESVDTYIQNSDMESLVNLVLKGKGQELIDKPSPNPEIQEFLNNVPAYMAKISSIHNAAYTGNMRDLQSLLDRKRLAEALDSSGRGPLHHAVLGNNSQVVRYLVNGYPQCIDLPDASGRTALHYAAVLQDSGAMYKVLIQAGADPNIKDHAANTPGIYLRRKDLLKLDDLINPSPLKSPRKSINPVAKSSLNNVDTWERPQTPYQVTENQPEISSVGLQTSPTNYSIIKISQSTGNSPSHSGKSSSDSEPDPPELPVQNLSLLNSFYLEVLSKESESIWSRTWKKLTATNGTDVANKYVRRYLTPKIFHKVKMRSTPRFNSTLLDCIKFYPQFFIVAPDPHAYDCFAEVFMPAIVECNGRGGEGEGGGGVGRSSSSSHPGMVLQGSASLAREFPIVDLPSKFIFQVRGRVSRNIRPYPFIPIMKREELYHVQKVVRSVWGGGGEMEWFDLDGMEKHEREVLAEERGVWFPEATKISRFWPKGRGFLVNASGSTQIWVNAEDHVDVVITSQYGRLRPLMEELVGCVDKFGEVCQFHENGTCGFLTVDPFRCGTGVKITFRLRLPNMMQNRSYLIQKCDELKLSLRWKQKYRMFGSTTEIAPDDWVEVENVGTWGADENFIALGVISGVQELIREEEDKGRAIDRATTKKKEHGENKEANN